MVWKEEDNKLRRSFEFSDFREAIAFINLVAFAAEEMQHHPEIYNVYNKVDISLCTHSAGDTVTAKDHKLSTAIDEVYEKFK